MEWQSGFLNPGLPVGGSPDGHDVVMLESNYITKTWTKRFRNELARARSSPRLSRLESLPLCLFMALSLHRRRHAAYVSAFVSVQYEPR